ncbi:uncharacterized protein LOC108669906 [Hyalella azteca]|uniref:Uncharacterized protein LOC108669906 n=1 Tax=Hyalella azteca TaxID=294128 RepID=A0A8B7NGS4_HYAAZ|nr:uncharacterized protein LOC108669906 [Hyalella azteca]
MAEQDWSTYGFKSLLMLLSQAQRNLSSRPNPEMNKFIFRTAGERWNLQKGQHLSLGCYSSFTVRRNVAMGHLKEDGAAEEGGEEEEDATKESACEGNPPTLVKIKFTPEVVGLGVKHLSPLSEDEREVLVSPLQNFTVTEVIKRAKKGFTVFMLEPVKA